MVQINPWASEQFEDYIRLRDEFGIEEFAPEGLPNPQKLFRRGVIFGHRGFELIHDAVINNKPFAILTGLMPSGKMHIGNKMVIDQVMYFQSLGADISIAVADIESYGTRGVSLEMGRKIAIEEYIINYIALGLKPERCQIYFQSKRTSVKDIAYLLSKKINLSEMRAIYGFEDSANMTHIFSPLVQVGDILHVQLKEYGGPRPTLVPVGVDQDPHMRLTRNVAFSYRLYNVVKTKDDRIGVFIKVDDNIQELLNDAEETAGKLGFSDFEKIVKYKALYINDADSLDIQKIDNELIPLELKYNSYGFYQPSSTYHRFMSGLNGGKMSSSVPDSSIFLTDTPEEGKKKVMKCKTGGRVSVEEQKKSGGLPEDCVVYELFLYHLIDKDEDLEKIFNDCQTGVQMCGQCKSLAAELIENFLKELQDKRENAR
ncbi:MAG: tryptophan--tRNA ligase, partial [Thermoplasmata archaeon]|nr:tryptophan--tRNA ligase [Thermoplasmata archaeon]